MVWYTKVATFSRSTLSRIKDIWFTKVSISMSHLLAGQLMSSLNFWGPSLITSENYLSWGCRLLYHIRKYSQLSKNATHLLSLSSTLCTIHLLLSVKMLLCGLVFIVLQNILPSYIVIVLSILGICRAFAKRGNDALLVAIVWGNTTLCHH